VNKFSLGLLGFGVVLGAGTLYLQHESIAELRGELAAMRTEVQQLAQQREAARREEARAAALAAVAPENPRTDADRAELAKLRDEVNALQKNTQELNRVAQAATQAARGESPIAVALTPVGELKSAGRATVKAALETVLAAATSGDVDTLTGSILLSPGAQAKAAEWFAGLTDATRAQYGSPEKVVALMLARDAAGITGIQVLGQRDLSADTVGVRVRLADEQGKTKEQGLAFQQTPDGMKALIPDATVEKYAKQLAGAGGGK